MKSQRKLKKIKSLMKTLNKLRNRNKSKEQQLPKTLEFKHLKDEDLNLNL